MKWSCAAITTAYQHLVEHNYVWLVDPQAGRRLGGSQTPQRDVVVKFRDWMRKNYAACKEQLITLLAHESRDIQVRLLLIT